MKKNKTYPEWKTCPNNEAFPSYNNPSFLQIFEDFSDDVFKREIAGLVKYCNIYILWNAKAVLVCLFVNFVDVIFIDQ